MSNSDYTTLQEFSDQPTSITETTLSETIGLSMHNLVANQQQSQVTTAASVSSTCARLLATPPAKSIKNNNEENTDTPEQKKKKGLSSLFSRS
ncbi:RebB family R body protein [Aliivibrio fischeri]|uniref:RebB family R body protein n=1 Tax=Aliivibrio fischeri TaxID=668 RepID=UPI0007C49187|nr:RebB family R body protein [Aliivibrio fischeri]MCE7536350.1 RebB family R body protein [Aliivibrio fischeri]MCE7554835.1 RebB family R body protein [Aliivibrio fischeri]MCE7559136.1 RebB family R body protein [Aliivibrio fischeri]MCE7562103.1 RebB family R body protein [Aliivibrio fischeri]MCE7565681.1 RebB family R body protein [Aliivibrio fischeri]